MGSCTCSRDIAPTPSNYGGTLKWTWADGHKYVIWRASPRFCNPMNCSNKACNTNGCRQARDLFCKTHGIYCQGLNMKVCAGDPCPGGLKTCLNSPAELPRYGDLPLCADLPSGGGGGGSSGGGGGSSGGSTGGKPGNCASGNPAACFSEIGDSIAKFFHNAGLFTTDASRTGGQQLPLFMLLGAGVLLVLLLKK